MVGRMFRHADVYFKTSARGAICCTSCAKLDVRNLEDTEHSGGFRIVHFPYEG
jgi:hypothetical protein